LTAENLAALTPGGTKNARSKSRPNDVGKSNQ